MGLKTPYNRTYQNQNERLIPYSFKKAVISALYPNNNSADIAFVGNNQTIVKRVPLASNLNIADINVGDRCKIDIFDPSNPNDMVLAYTYGGKSSGPLFATGTATPSIGTVGDPIAHGLGVVPNCVFFIMTSTPGNGPGTVTYSVWMPTPPDSTNIYLASFNHTVTVKWYAIRF